MNDVSALIKTFLRDNYLFDCVQSLKNCYPNLSIIIADDSLPDKLKKNRLLDLGVDKYIQLPFNVGISHGRNILVEACQTPFFLLGDDDFHYTIEGNLAHLRTMMAISDIAAGSLIQDGGYIPWAYNFIEKDNNLLLCEENQTRHYQNISYKSVDVVHNFFIAKTESVKRVLWDAQFTTCHEHEDFFLRAKQSGLRVVFCPEATVLHKKLGTPNPEAYKEHRYKNTEMKALFQQKWGINSIRFA